jgi:membrane protein insertase Oxa1/YidC/SpoIIIJ
VKAGFAAPSTGGDVQIRLDYTALANADADTGPVYKLAEVLSTAGPSPLTTQAYAHVVDNSANVYFLVVDPTGGPATKLFGVSIGATFSAGGWAAVLCGILGVVMIATTYMTSRQMILKTGWAEDPTQKMMQKLMLYGIPATLIISAVAFPLGLIIYWTTSNLFSLGQQMWVLKKYPPPKMAGAKAEPKAPLDPEVAKALAPKVGAKPAVPSKPAAPKPSNTKPTGKRKTVKKNVG